MDRDDVVGDEHVAVLRLIRDAPSLLPQQLSVLAAQEKALAEAITDRLATPDPAYARLCATTAFAALRVVLDRWLERAEDDATPPPTVLRSEVGEAFAMLAAGLDRDGTSSPCRGSSSRAAAEQGGPHRAPEA